MASSREDGTAAAAEQLRSMSLGDKSVDRKDSDPDAEKNKAPTKLCSACGEKSDALKKCRACKCVWYCDKDCQNKHWKEHKHECRRIKSILDQRGGKLDVGTEKDVGPLGKLPTREECPICMHTLPIHPKFQGYYACCGKRICGGCNFQHQMKNQERPLTCAFCRTAAPRSDEELLAQYRKRVELKDPVALRNLAMDYGSGRNGLPVDQVKCVELLRESASLGFPGAQYNLGTFYHQGKMGLEQNEEEARKYYKEAAEGGHMLSLHNLGCAKGENGDPVAAMRHWRLSASGGHKTSMGALIVYFEYGWLHHADLTETLQALYLSRFEMKSEGRDQHIAYLKMIGEYHAEYE